MLRPIDNYFLQKEEPVKSCMQFLRSYILGMNEHISEKWQYGMPFFYYRDKRLCYLWVEKKSGHPYLGIVDGNKVSHPDLISEKRARMKIMLIDPAKDIPVSKIKQILSKAISIK